MIKTNIIKNEFQMVLSISNQMKYYYTLPPSELIYTDLTDYVVAKTQTSGKIYT